MNPIRFILPLLILVALIGAPFGMGRMMDGAHLQSQHTAMAGMDHGDMVGAKAGDHKPNTLHFVMCSATVAVQAAAPMTQLLSFEIERPLMVAAAALRRADLLPVTPPPRA
jgi:hypothetical protein